MNQQEVIRLENAMKVYPGDFVALDATNLSINRGEFVSIVGQTGAGKSTMLKLIYAEENPTMGEIYFNGKSVKEIKRKHLPTRLIFNKLQLYFRNPFILYI